MFAGQPYRCGVTRFSNESEVLCASQPDSMKGAGCNTTGYPHSVQAACDPPCAPGYGLLYDHCKGCTP